MKTQRLLVIVWYSSPCAAQPFHSQLQVDPLPIKKMCMSEVCLYLHSKSIPSDPFLVFQIGGEFPGLPALWAFPVEHSPEQIDAPIAALSQFEYHERLCAYARIGSIREGKFHRSEVPHEYESIRYGGKKCLHQRLRKKLHQRLHRVRIISCQL